jgi:hypothetical protein
MHSWSAKGRWQACCYTPDHAQKERMWSKPRELTTYKGNGYEIAAGGSGKITADQALTLWKGHPPHNEVIVNKGIWMAKWNAIGIGIYNKYAVVWFGRDTDQEGEPARPSTR